MERYPRLRDLREDADLTQAQVGQALHLTQRAYAYYESGQRMLPPQVLCALARYYGVSVDYLLGETDVRARYPAARSCPLRLFRRRIARAHILSLIHI